MEILKDRWRTRVIGKWEDFDREIEKMLYRAWLFRGQSNAKWDIKSSLYRLFQDVQPIVTSHKGRKRRFVRDEYEKILIKQFQTNAHLYLNALPDKLNNVEWLAIMQHYGAPTRLIDTTFSPHVAAYFALEQGSEDCCVYAFKHARFCEMDEASLNLKDYKKRIFEGHKGEESFLVPYEPEMANERIVAQQGCFLIPSTNYETLDQIIDQYGVYGEECIRYLIPKHLRYSGINRLKQMNITSATLFPGMEGFCRSLKFQVLETTSRLKRLG